MTHHLTATDYHVMPWANGLGKTTEMVKYEDNEGRLLWRLSMATVTEDGPFSLFANVERSLTVLSGDGFDLIEDESGLQHSAALLTPVAFSGETPLSAKNVTALCQDFNVMTKSDLPKPLIWVKHQAPTMKIIMGAQLALFSLSPSTLKTIDGVFTLKAHELLLCQKSVEIREGRVICVILSSDYASK